MSMTADQIVDRRRLRRKVSFWRFIGVVAVVLAVGGALLAAGVGNGKGGGFVTQPQIARISVSGFIAEDRDQAEMLAKLAKNDSVKGVIVAINSTGGSTTGGEALYEGLRKLAAAKPTVATIGTVGASAAYMAAIATDHIVARRTSITGSIGVIFEYPEVSALLDKLGVKVEDIKSAPLKAEPDPFHPTSDEARAVVQGLVTDTFNWFVDIVAERRKLDRAVALTYADGRIYTGQQALNVKLIDELGGEEAAIAWLGSKGVDAKLPVKDWEPQRPGKGPFSLSAAATDWLLRTIGLAPAVSPALIDRLLPDGLKLDGLLSVWQGSSGGDT
ncbi:MAG TPA: signal peptide peptidase SppA [Bauldia sp.]|nr:signal peptide peptidase SppA [Bauldia sp.]